MPILQPLLCLAWQKGLFGVMSPQTGSFPSLWTSDLIPYPGHCSPTFPRGWRGSLSPLWPRISRCLHTPLLPKPLFPWTLDVFLLQPNKWGEGKEIKTVPGKAEFNSTSQFQAEKLLPWTFYKLYSQPSLKAPKKVHLNESVARKRKLKHLDAKSYNSSLNQILISAVFKEFWLGRAEIQFWWLRKEKPGLQRNNKSVRVK